eukprot:TRINITY_DN3388_c0_g1_i1.p1 TRINITY_DN3388_c0_g1~~TRINITY_DN3388_c0_g1_i1.p1  ORF type:complete len:371 (-),score=97.36 TRINITY_DN3388_c0_g1_i1:156-1268(-)
MTGSTNHHEAPKVSVEQLLQQYRTIIDKNIEKWFPRKLDEKGLRFFCGSSASFQFDAEAATQAISVPCWDILDRGGKRWRPVLMILVGEAFGSISGDQKDTILNLATLCELIHNGSLMVDDIEDNSELRRGKPCAHHIYGTDIAINAGNALYFLPMVVIRELKGKLPDKLVLDLYDIIVQECINLHFGQGMDIYWHQGKSSKSPSVVEYLQMCAFKTGTLARMACKLGALVTGAEKSVVDAFGKFGEVVGVGFQIQDDVLNLVGERFSTSVTGEDITEGKRSLMVIHCLHNAPEEDAKRLLSILNLHTKERQLIDEAISILQKNGSITYAKDMGKKMIVEAWASVEPLITSAEVKAGLKTFTDFLVEREI